MDERDARKVLATALEMIRELAKEQRTANDRFEALLKTIMEQQKYPDAFHERWSEHVAQLEQASNRDPAVRTAEILAELNRTILKLKD